jgi:hypothetical protein
MNWITAYTFTVRRDKFFLISIKLAGWVWLVAKLKLVKGRNGNHGPSFPVTGIVAGIVEICDL